MINMLAFLFQILSSIANQLPLAATVTGIGGTGFGIGYKVYKSREKEREAINRLSIEINELNIRLTRVEQNTNLILDKLIERGIR